MMNHPPHVPVVGLLIPPENPTVAHEVTSLLPGARVDVRKQSTVDGDLAARLDGYREEVPQLVEAMSQEGVDAVAVGCTGCYYSLAADEVVALDQGRGVPVANATASLLRVLGRLGVSSLTLVSPYPAWLTDLSERFWTAAGFQVLSVEKIPGTGKIYDLTAEEIISAMEAVLGGIPTDARPDAVLVTGTGAPSLPALDALAPGLGMPLLSSNLATAWAVADELGTELLGAGPESPAMQELLKRVAEADAKAVKGTE